MNSNPALQKIEQSIMAKVPEQLRSGVQRTVVAGMKVMHSPQTHDMMTKQLTKPGDPAENAGEGAAKLVGILYQQSNRKAPIRVLVPAGQILLCEGLSFMEQAGQIKVTNEVIAKATNSYASNLLQLFGVTPEKLQQMMIKAQTLQQQGAQQQPAQPQPAQPQPAQASGLVGGAMQGA